MLGDLLLVIFISVIGSWLAGAFDKPVQTEAKKECGLHTWTYNHEEKLQCTECSQVAG